MTTSEPKAIYVIFTRKQDGEVNVCSRVYTSKEAAESTAKLYQDQDLDTNIRALQPSVNGWWLIPGKRAGG